MNSKYRIIQQPDGRVYVQKKGKLLWLFTRWAELGVYTYAGLMEPQIFLPTDYISVAIAKDCIDQLLETEKQWNQPPIITPYPAPSSASPA